MARQKKEAAPEVAAEPVGIMPTQDFSFVYHSHLLDFRRGVTFYPDAQLLAALKAANAPMKD